MKFYSGYSRLCIVQALIRISVRGDFLAFQKCQGEHLIINNEYLKLSLSNLHHPPLFYHVVTYIV